MFFFSCLKVVSNQIELITTSNWSVKLNKVCHNFFPMFKQGAVEILERLLSLQQEAKKKEQMS